ncbi:DUF4145 domain-containing protein [Klebsiella sp. Ap-873]|nr:DUF4145 domain-containing protein [Klebsiella sp. Ap-873]
MGILSFDITCPHCLRENAVLQAFSQHQRHNDHLSDVPFFCRSCDRSGIAVVRTNIGHSPLAYSQSKDVVITASPGSFELINVYPTIEEHSAPENSPLRASDSFIEAKDNLKRGKFDTAVMLCRKTIDIATRSLLGDNSRDEKLVKRIEILRGRDLITEQMKDWAHIVRIDSNGAVHSDEEFTKEEAEEMIGFTEVFLIYSFTLPAMVTAKQQASATNKN